VHGAKAQSCMRAPGRPRQGRRHTHTHTDVMRHAQRLRVGAAGVAMWEGASRRLVRAPPARLHNSPSADLHTAARLPMSYRPAGRHASSSVSRSAGQRAPAAHTAHLALTTALRVWWHRPWCACAAPHLQRWAPRCSSALPPPAPRVPASDGARVSWRRAPTAAASVALAERAL
jgi:hypothetical protein